MEGGKLDERPVTAISVAASLTNPWIGIFVEDLTPTINEIAPILGKIITDKLIGLLPADRIEAYGKWASVGLDCKIEQGFSRIDTLEFGHLFREASNGTTYLSFTNTCNAAASLLSLPMTRKSATGSRSHFIAHNFQIADPPVPGEILIAISTSDECLPNARIGARFLDMKQMGIKQ